MQAQNVCKRCACKIKSCSCTGCLEVHAAQTTTVCISVSTAQSRHTIARIMPTSRQATRSVATHVWRVKKDCSGHTSRGKKFKRRVKPKPRVGPGVLSTGALLLAVTASSRTCSGRCTWPVQAGWWPVHLATRTAAVQCERRTATRSRVRLQLLAADADEVQRVSEGKPSSMLALGSALQAPSGGPVAREDR